jgi:hypothetical protein
MALRSISNPRWRAAGLLTLGLLAGQALAEGNAPASEPQRRLMADWPQRLTAAGCPTLPGQPDKRRCTTRDSFAVCKVAVDSGHLKRCELAGTKETYPASR